MITLVIIISAICNLVTCGITIFLFLKLKNGSKKDIIINLKNLIDNITFQQ